MAAMSTALVEFADNGDSRTYTTSGHSASKPKIVIQKRRVPAGNQILAEVSVSVIHATEDSVGAVLPQKVALTASAKYPITGDYADVTAALVILRDIVASDEFTATLASQNWLA